MTTQTADRIKIWDGWRGLAISLVLCGHFFDIKWIWEDRLGVDVFFVLSGMLMSIILFEKRMSLTDFYIRRISRIIPLLIVVVIAMFTIASLFSKPYQLVEIPATLLFIRTYFPASPGIWDAQTATGHLWSLNVEEHAYIIMSVLTLIFASSRYAAIALITMALLSITVCTFYYVAESADAFELKRIRTESAVCFVFFSAGYGLLKRQKKLQLSQWAPPLLALLAALCYVNSLPAWLSFTVAPIALGIAVNHLENIPDLFQRLLSGKLLCQLGIWSYSLYLWQQFFYEYSWKIPGGAPVALAIALLVGAISFHFFENPVRQLINRRWSANPAYAT